MKLQLNRYGPASFRPPFDSPRRAVLGGRFKVRRLKYFDEKPWRAWTEGLASRQGKWFKTQAEAIEWAYSTSVAYQKERRDCAR